MIIGIKTYFWTLFAFVSDWLHIFACHLYEIPPVGLHNCLTQPVCTNNSHHCCFIPIMVLYMEYEMGKCVALNCCKFCHTLRPACITFPSGRRPKLSHWHCRNSRYSKGLVGYQNIYKGPTKIILLLEFIVTLDTSILASKKSHTFECIKYISYFYFSFFCEPPL